MALATPERPQLSTDTRRLFAQLRREIRRYVWVEGLALTVAALGLAFWIAVSLDWLFEPPALVRRGLIGLGLLAGAVTFYLFVIRRLAVPLPDSRLALLLERRFRHFDDSLLTSVDFSGADHQLGDLGREMLAHTCREADERAQRVEVGEVFHRAPRTRALAAAGTLLATLILSAAAFPSTLLFAADRLSGRTDEVWPRRTRLYVRGFENGEQVVARGDDVEVLVQADMSMPLVPELVQIRARSEDGLRTRDTMTKVGNAGEGDEFQDFHYKFAGVLNSLSFDVWGGDARVSDLRVRVVESPTVRATVLACEYPAYMNRPPRELPVTGTMQLPVGTKITIHCEANKDLSEVRMEYPQAGGTTFSETHGFPAAPADCRHFAFDLPPLEADKTIQFSLLDTDGIRKPFTLPLAAVSDLPPQLSLQLRGIGTAITPIARLPLIGKIEDDYGVAAARFTATIDDKLAEAVPFAAPPAGRSEIDVDEAFEVRDLKLKPGQRLVFGAEATDAYHLVEGDEPHTAQGARFQLDIVAPETLRAMLESRELNLRQRFETIISEVTETRNALAETPADDAAAAADSPTGATGSEEEAAAAGKPADGAASTSADTARPAPATKGPSAEQLRVERARQNAEKNAQETLGVADAFDEICEELINNRVDTEELKIRLKDRIALPLRHVGGDMFSQWDRRLKTLQEQAENGAAAPQARQAAVAEADAILVELARVRDMMLELESFNEAVDMLRSIIDSEKALQEQIRERQKRKVRDLLEDPK